MIIIITFLIIIIINFVTIIIIIIITIIFIISVIFFCTAKPRDEDRLLVWNRKKKVWGKTVTERKRKEKEKKNITLGFYVASEIVEKYLQNSRWNRGKEEKKNERWKEKRIGT